MTTTLATEIISVERAEKRAATAVYRDLVRRFDNPRKGDAAKAIKICRLLGISTAEIAADAKAYGAMPDLGELASEAEGLMKTAQKAARAVKAKEREAQQVAEKLKAERRQLVTERDSALHSHSIAVAAARRIERIQAERWRIFEAPKPAPPELDRLRGDLAREAALRWLDEEPTRARFDANGNAAVVRVLEERGYKLVSVGIWEFKGDGSSQLDEES